MTSSTLIPERIFCPSVSNREGWRGSRSHTERPEVKSLKLKLSTQISPVSGRWPSDLNKSTHHSQHVPLHVLSPQLWERKQKYQQKSMIFSDQHIGTSQQHKLLALWPQGYPSTLLQTSVLLVQIFSSISVQLSPEELGRSSG